MGILNALFGGNNSNEKLVSIVKEGAFLVDVRSPGEFAGGNVKGSVNIPLDQLQNQLSKFKDKKNIIVFCRSGNRSSQAKSILERNGFNNVTNGGTWQNINTIVTK
ncbi:rhodanese-like domain-containing protein [Flavobacterium caeni]|uniref:Rhodanese-related sulfurtransferase n=1 Tax=Flavobacterium caeni TaxID=490189 RepID=A0A1G5K8X3_9FLAO|nr:rhodanese-like domain-containing protein [Flavobacterium caeni]SCY96478.1 Rhodanese-related sulfurtransferase [Flavobacterium caeni]